MRGTALERAVLLVACLAWSPCGLATEAVEPLDVLLAEAQAHAASGRLTALEGVFDRILRLKPDYAPDPKIFGAKSIARFEKVRARVVGHVVLSLTPPDATIALDGIATSADPEGRLFVTAGDHTLRFERRGYDTSEVPVQIPAGGVAAIRVDLLPNSRTLIVRAEPEGVEVRVGGRLLGKTIRPQPGEGEGGFLPAELVLEDLPPGEYLLELSAPCHRPMRIKERNTVDLLDRSARALETITLERASATVRWDRVPDGATLRVGGDAAVPLPPVLELCPGEQDLTVERAGRVQWKGRIALADGEERVLDISPRPNLAVVRPATEQDLTSARGMLNVVADLEPPPGLDLTRLASWPSVGLSPDVDLAVARLLEPEEGASGRLILFSPLLGTIRILPPRAFPESRRPSWSVCTFGLRLADSDLSGTGTVVDVVDGGPAAAAAIHPGDRVIEVAGAPVDGARGARDRLRQVVPGSTVTVRVVGAGGKDRTVPVECRRSASVPWPHDSPGEFETRAAWAQVDSGSAGEGNFALANLAFLQTATGAWRFAEQTWRRVKLPEREGIGSGTRDYFLGRTLAAQGKDREAVEAFVRARDSRATVLDDEGPEVRKAAMDHLADLGVTSASEHPPVASSATAR